MGRRRRGILIMDASVLIDLCAADRTLIALISDQLGPVHVPLPLLREEVQDIAESDCAELGIVAVEPSLEMIVDATSRRGGLSFHDRICLLLAQDHGWTCVTNDAALRRACGEAGVAVLWGLEVVALLVEEGALPAADAAEVGRAIRAANPYITERVLHAFLERIGAGEGPTRRRRRRKGTR
jgi:predicted nucleic acid-binding protein